MAYRRKLREDEERLLDFLIKKSKMLVSSEYKENLLVEPMNDGNMGSLNLFPDSSVHEKLFGKTVSDCMFKDRDGVMVIASLNVDKDNQLYELDIWKTNFEPLIEIPYNFFDVE